MRIAASIERAWAAGFFDGEGTVGSYVASTPNGTRNGIKVGANVCQHTSEELSRFAEAVGMGLLYDRRGNNERKGWTSANFVLVINGYEKVQQLACLLWPYLCTKKRQQFTEALKKAQRYYASSPRCQATARLLAEQANQLNLGVT